MSKSFVNPLSQLDINRKFEKYISISIYSFHRGSFMNYVFIAYKKDAWCHFVEVSKYISPSQMNLIFTTYTNINSLKLKTVVKNFSIRYDDRGNTKKLCNFISI